ncbi:Putative tRNA/rRNA methyltransferase BB_0052 [Chlamydiales bacterium SCGC AB-751-O23]|jgi:tRNA (guanosine-2'-O-)-methyltransferase|nr:Putative tRNA/rRNA methyltransferase BB_0052 [Chlamydiales bacterium SCGC AB-751-O23]
MDSEKEIFNKYLDELGLESFIQTLSPFLTDSRKSKISVVLDQRLDGIRLAIESPVDIHNVFAAVRSTEALGVMNVDLIKYQKAKKLTSNATTSGSHRWVSLNSFPTFPDYQQAMREKGYLIVGASHTGELTLSELPLDQNIALMFGNEHSGLEPNTLKNCDLTFQIPMYGMVESYNLSVSCALALHYYSHKKRQAIKSLGNLTKERKEIEKAWYYFKSLGTVETEMILRKSLINLS